MNEFKILLIRHGFTEANEKRVYAGITDLPLTENGRKKLVDMRKTYENRVSDKAIYFTSGFKRANETLQILFGNSDKPLNYEVLSDFRELDFGRFEMHSYDELKEDEEYIAWISDDDYEAHVPPGGESGNQMSERVVNAFEKLVSTLDDKTEAVIVCHGGTIYYIMKYLFPNEQKTMYEWEPKNGCGYLLKRDKNGYTYEAIK